MKIDAKNTELCKAYMLKMWHFDKYMIAYYPALQLTKKDPTNGLAWGIVGYYQAMRGNYLKALGPTLQAAKCMPDDAATMANAGRLVTWYEKTKPQPKISPELKSLIELGKLGWAGVKEFSEGSVSYSKKLGDMKKKADKLAGEISEKKKRIGSLAGEYKKLDEECRKKNKEGSDQWNHRKNLLNQLAEVERKRPGDLRKKRDEFKKKIQEVNKKIGETRRAIANLNGKAFKIKKEVDSAKKAIRKLEAQIGGPRPKFDFRRPGGEGKTAAAASKVKPKVKPKDKPKGKGKGDE